MRVFNKYKFYPKLLLNSYPLRILKFKRTKWKKFQKKVKTLSIKKCLYKHNVIVALKSSWYRIKLFFKNKLKLKNKYKCNYDDLLRFKQKQKNNYNKLIQVFLLKEFLLEILLWHLGFFLSVHHANESVFLKLILVNNEIYKSKQILKKGDIVTFAKDFQITKKIVSKEIYYSFVEIDFYTNTIILTKNISNLNNMDLSLIIQEIYDFYYFKTFLKP